MDVVFFHCPLSTAHCPLNMADKRDYYEVLGVARTATEVEITKAYRVLAKQHHPDRNIGDDEAKARYAEVDEAYAVLNDAGKRARYDRHGHAGVEGLDHGGAGPDLGDLFGGLGGLIGDFSTAWAAGAGGAGRAAARASPPRWRSNCSRPRPACAASSPSPPSRCAGRAPAAGRRSARSRRSAAAAAVSGWKS